MYKKIIAFIIFMGLLGTFYYVQFKEKIVDDKIVFEYRDDFNELNRDFWFLGEWQTMDAIYDKVDIKNGILNLEVKETDRGPFLLSKPFPISKGDVLTVKRRVKIHYSNNNFTGGLAITQTDESDVKPVANDENWARSLGQAAMLVEYVHNYNEKITRPGRDLFRVLPPTWESDDNYAVVEPIFDDWFEEEIIYDTRTNKITYKINGKEFKVNGLEIDKPNLRIFMHSYGWYTDHYVKIDWIEIKVEDKKIGNDK